MPKRFHSSSFSVVGLAIANSLRAACLGRGQEFVRYCYFIPVILSSALLAPVSWAQGKVPESGINAVPFRAESKTPGTAVVVPEYLSPNAGISKGKKPPAHFSKQRFLILSAGVYAAGLADMHQTMHNKQYSWWYESDPLAKPLVKLPVPAYYAAGLALATGVNWLSWKMGHSRKWRKVALLPQLFAITGNSYGFKSNCCRDS